MSIWDAALHALNFGLPAVFVALLMSLAGRLFLRNKPMAGKFPQQFAINLVVNLLVLLAGLLITGRDGKMLTYAAMVVAGGITQWILSGAWRK